VAGAALALVATVGILSQLPRQRQVSAASRPGPSAMPTGCSGYAALRRPEQAAGLRFLPSWLPPGTRITYASARADLLAKEDCPRVPTALVLATFNDEDRSRVVRAVVLTGPSPARYPLPNAAALEDVDVRGTRGTLVRYPTGVMSSPSDVKAPYATSLRLLWTEGDGTTWELRSNHVDATELVRLADALVLDSTGETPAAFPSPPEGFEVLYQRTARPAPAPAEIPWWVAYTGSGKGEVDYIVVVRRMAPDNPAITAVIGENATVLTVRGHRAVASRNNPGDDAGTLTWDEAPGVTIELQGPGGINTLTRIAESLTYAPPNDRRIRD
jgi:hypothetical protein